MANQKGKEDWHHVEKNLLHPGISAVLLVEQVKTFNTTGKNREDSYQTITVFP